MYEKFYVHVHMCIISLHEHLQTLAKHPLVLDKSRLQFHLGNSKRYRQHMFCCKPGKIYTYCQIVLGSCDGLSYCCHVFMHTLGWNSRFVSWYLCSRTAVVNGNLSLISKMVSLQHNNFFLLQFINLQVFLLLIFHNLITTWESQGG